MPFILSNWPIILLFRPKQLFVFPEHLLLQLKPIISKAIHDLIYYLWA
jgi:hypothetical protein